MTSAAAGQVVGTPLSFPDAGTAAALVLAAAAELGAAPVVVDAGVDVPALALAELLLLLHPLTPRAAPTRQAQAKARRRVGRERLIMVIPLFGRRTRAVPRTASQWPVTAA
jgi:hypothetical protein